MRRAPQSSGRECWSRIARRQRAGDEAAGPLRKGVVGDWRNHFSPELGRFLIEVADERLALGEKIVTNTTASTWKGKQNPVAGGARAS